MRNSSDIFCLKEPKVGENDGTQIFSVKGSTSVKINRRQQNTSEVFQYGQPKMEKLSETGEEIMMPHGGPEGDEPKPIVEEPVVACSSMKRNPLTGDGVELDEQRSSRKACMEKSGKWMW